MAHYTIPISSPTGHRIKSKLVMEDPGFTHDFVTHDLAEKMVGEQGSVTRTKVYKMCLLDVQGRIYQMEAIGMESQLALYPAPETEYKASKFPVVDHHGGAAFRRPHGEVQLLLGMTSCSLHCKDGMEARNFSKTRAFFTLDGSSPVAVII